MANQYINFSYDPKRDGFSSSMWHDLYGSVAIVGGKLDFTRAAIIHYGDILRGDAVFSVNIDTPTPADDIKFGFVLYNKNEYAYFKVAGTVLTATTSDGTNTTSVVIPWQTAWSSTDTEFRVKWESGMVTFYIAGNYEACINDATVPGDPMSLYVDGDSISPLVLNYIDVKSIQSYVTSEGNSTSSFESLVKTSEIIRITESVTVSPATTMAISLSDSVSISDVPSVPKLTYNVNDYDTVNASESKTVTTPA